ncbi:MAG: hypothetical protein ABRQ39_28015, partial [Candidatus Eremiobacterota bacterium]
YVPSLLSINILHIVGGISWLYIFGNYKIIKRIIKIEHLTNLYILFAVLAVYIILIAIINENPYTVAVYFWHWLFNIIPASIMVTCYLFKHDYTIEDLINILLIAGILQSIIAILSFAIPSTQMYFVEQLASDRYSGSYYRMFGMASDLTYTTPIVQSILAIIALYLAINKKWKYIILIPVFVFSAIINARTSIIIMGIGLIVCILPNFSIKRLIKFAVIIGVVLVMIYYCLIYVQTEAPETYNWIFEGNQQIISLFQGDTSYGYFSYVTNSTKYPLPEGLGLIFGVGRRIMGFNRYNLGTDIGYINDLWLGGIIYCIFIYSLFCYILYGILKADGGRYRLNKFIFYFFATVLIVGNIKGYIFSNNNVTSLLFLFYTYMVLFKTSISTSTTIGKSISDP